MDLFPNDDFSSQPLASTSRSLLPSSSAASFDFALDPSLSQQVASSSRLGPSYDDDSDGGDESVEEDSDDDDDDEDSDSDDETDAEEEYRLEMTQGGGAKRKKGGPVAGLTEMLQDKGKGKETAQEGTFAGFDDGEELGRLIHAIRDSSDTNVGGRTLLDKEFDRTIEEEMEGLDDPLNNGMPKKNKRRAYGPRPEPEPSTEVKDLLGRANRHYALGEGDQAIELLTEVVRIEPSLRVPWYTLASIYEEKGDTEKAVGFKMIAAHLMPVKRAAVEWASLGAQSRDIGLLQQAIYCFTQAIKGDKDDVDSMWDRAVLLKMSGSIGLATTAFTALLNIHPHDPGVLRELVPLLTTSNLYGKASQLYLSAFDHYRSICPHITAHTLPLISSFGPQDLETIADILNHLGMHARSIEILKRGVRWLQGREQETGWEMLDDDREFDLVRKTRVGWEREARFLEEAGVNELDVRLRLRLGVARMAKGDAEEAQRHFAIVLQEDVAEFPELFGAIGDSYYNRKMYDDALDVFQIMAECDDTNGASVWAKIGLCHLETDDADAARECFEAVAEAEPDNLKNKMHLAKCYEALQEHNKALLLINEVIATRRKQDAGKRKTGPRPMTKEARAARTADRLAAEQQRHQEFSLALITLKRLEPSVNSGDIEARAEWLEVATYLVDAFRETKELFPADSNKKFTGVQLQRSWKRKGVQEGDLELQADEMANRLERRMNEESEPLIEVDSYRGIHFDDWLELIMKYSILLTKNDEIVAGQETLVHVTAASVFRQSPQRMLAIHLARASCYAYTKNYVGLVEVARWIQRQYQYQTDGLRLLYAFLPGGSAAVEAFNNGPLQKFTIRQLRTIDAIVRGAPVKLAVNGSIVLMDEKQGAGADKEEEGEEGATTTGGTGRLEDKFLPKKASPAYNLGYGQMLMVSRSYASAIIYLLRAYDLAPKQPMINLTLGVAYLLRAMSRQTDNRAHQIAQALAFFSQYKALKGSCQEVEYNFGRAFHHLGLQSYAVKHYEACLSLAAVERQTHALSRMAVDDDAGAANADDELDEPDDYARLAAYNLSNLYMLSGSADLARAVARKWLAI
ncbi:hypothetical protein BCR35DRAFT_284512 [Leucosporidium creatinivorum]|uniref:TPR-like protein n=1 Tax=Leucosporidium creatinivorum TaxID=106004 RepID=A0A1Y2D7D0_9BASI|nr:hypothetical protein BCR35DRAFT_284512 [Leucosporidium creatinivorum]